MKTSFIVAQKYPQESHYVVDCVLACMITVATGQEPSRFLFGRGGLRRVEHKKAGDQLHRGVDTPQ